MVTKSILIWWQFPSQQRSSVVDLLNIKESRSSEEQVQQQQQQRLVGQFVRPINYNLLGH